MTLTEQQLTHRRRVLRLQDIIAQHTRGHMTRETAEGLLVNAGCEPAAIKQLLDSAAKKLVGVK